MSGSFKNLERELTGGVSDDVGVSILHFLSWYYVPYWMYRVHFLKLDACEWLPIWHLNGIQRIDTRIYNAYEVKCSHTDNFWCA